MIKKVLAVDNDPFILEFMKDVLPPDKYELFTAKDGLHALDILETITPDIVFVDLVMPKISGKKLCKIIREMERLKNAFVVILSSTIVEQQIDAEKLGVNACIAKGPIELMAQHVLDVLDHPDVATINCAAGEMIGVEKYAQRQITSELLSMKKHSEAILEVMHEGIIEVLSTGRIVYVNPAGLSLLGIPESQILGTNFFQLFPETDKSRVFAACQNPMDTESTCHQCRVHINGHELILRVLFIKNKNDDSLIFMLKDITKERLMETNLLQAKKRATLGTLAGGIAHNFNNLLTAIQCNISLLMLEGGINHKASKIIDKIERYVQSGSSLTSELIKLAKGGCRELKPTDLNQIVKNSSKMFGDTNNQIRIHQRLQKEIWMVDADAGQLEQVFLNLYVNAQQAMPDGGELFLETQNVTLKKHVVESLGMNGRHYVKISVQDTGNGMDEKTRERIFEPFFTTKSMGSGLGLATAQDTIKSHKGIITVLSEQGNGATFEIFLPVSYDQLIMKEHPCEKASAGEHAVLFREDEKWICDTGRQMMKQIGC